MRGPVATKVVNQLIGSTQWGELDYLIVDMPPGNTMNIKLLFSNYQLNLLTYLHFSPFIVNKIKK